MKTAAFSSFARLLFTIAWLAAAAGAAAAESLLVTTPFDEDNGTSDPAFGTGTSLREAIQYANTDGFDSTITFHGGVFAAPRQTITLGGTPLPALIANGALMISAPAAGVEISGNNASRVFQVAAGARVTMTGLTIRNGNAGVNFGGGIENAGTLTLDACTLHDNTATSGGAISSNTDLTVSLTLRNCTLSGNTATARGGAILRAPTPMGWPRPSPSARPSSPRRAGGSRSAVRLWRSRPMAGSGSRPRRRAWRSAAGMRAASSRRPAAPTRR